MNLKTRGEIHKKIAKALTSEDIDLVKQVKADLEVYRAEIKSENYPDYDWGEMQDQDEEAADEYLALCDKVIFILDPNAFGVVTDSVRSPNPPYFN